MTGFLRASALALAGIGSIGCGGGECMKQSCADWGGSDSVKFKSCYVSGSESGHDEFWLEDLQGNEFHKCTRPPDDNDGCGVEMIRARHEFCAKRQ
jgi:hypothetical protein